MRLAAPLLLALPTAILALPPPYYYNPPPNPLNLTVNTSGPSSPLIDDPWPTICYSDLYSRPVTHDSCGPLIDYFARSRDFLVPKRWTPGPREPQWRLQACKLRLVSGRWDSAFSMGDVVKEMERVLRTCQPPGYLGVGGSAPVGGQGGLWYAAFHVQVTGVSE
ncbi:MAG: hypothetical protein ALECFALPRED_000292 [Alectoria fallacina]|uniref:Ecp2 effector protein domain-containing protein n=1 Tax=Alectoria fallacina TaxID=1903189 RepID=A0A8H3PL34_9LECA|nr:MAG: hypothetical protein ALECFALPRED_000292 [Alectoria fallacina]